MALLKTRRIRGGVHPAYHRELAAEEPIRRAAVPALLTVPLSQHTGVPCEAVVSAGEQVAEGQPIGRASGRISAAVHAPVSGTVKRVEPAPHPLGRKAMAVLIEPDGREDRRYLEPLGEAVETLAPEAIRERVREAGIVGLGGAAFPAHVKYSPPAGRPIDVLIINGCECEPYLTADYRIMVEHAADVVLGARLIAHTLGVERIVAAVEDDKPRALERLQEKGGQALQYASLPARYPQGAEKVLIKALLDREVPRGGLPLDVGVVVANVGTARAVAEAVRDGKPLIERVVTVTGGGVRRPGNFLARIGTPFSALLEEAGGLTGPAGKLVMGGPMMGVAQLSLETPVVKGTSGLLVQPAGEAATDGHLPCIRCGLCVRACPMGLLPSTLSVMGEARRWELAEGYGVFDCIECGCCTYVCPAKRPIVQWVRETKLHLRAAKSK